MSKLTKSIVAGCAVFIIILAARASAQTLINGQMNVLGSTYNQTGYAWFGQAGDTWNEFTWSNGSGTSGALISSTGATQTGTSFSLSGNGAADNTYNLAGNGDDNPVNPEVYNLGADEFFNNNHTMTFTLSGLPASVAFQLVIYGGPSFTLSTANGGSGSATTPVTDSLTGSHILVSGTTTATGNITGTINYGSGGAGGNNYDDLTAFQVQIGSGGGGLSLTGADIGSVGLAGSSSLSSGIYTIKGSGTDIYGTADAFQFDSQTMTGNGIILAQVTSQTNTNSYAKAGVMMRNSLGASDIEASTFVHPAELEEFDYRPTSGASTVAVVSGTNSPAPYWVMLARSGSSFTSYISPNGATWTLVGTETITMGSTIDVGLAVSAHNNAALSMATFANVQLLTSASAAPTGLAATAGNAQNALSWTASTGATSYNIYRGTSAGGESTTAIGTTTSASYTDTGLSNGTTYYYEVKAVNVLGTSGYSNEAHATPASSGIAAVTANKFLNSLGVCTHITQGADSEASVATVLAYTGIRNIRDDGTTNSTTLGYYTALHSSAGTLVNILPPDSTIADCISEYETLAAGHALLSVEGPNEPNNFNWSYNGYGTQGSSTYLGLAQFQTALYAAVKGDSNLAGIPVFASSESGGSEPNNVGLQFLTIPSGSGVTLMPIGTQYADYGNCHNYMVNPTFPNPADNVCWAAEFPTANWGADGLYSEYGDTWSKGFTGYNTTQLQTLPRVTTETGWYSATDAPAGENNPVSEDQQGKLFLDLYLSAVKEGWSYTFIYYLHDTSAQGYWGLVHTDYSNKASATYVHNLTTILADTANFTPGALNYSIASEPSTVHDLLLQKSNGTFYLAVWDDRPVGEGTNSVTVNLGGTHTVTQYDPTVGTTGTSLGSVSSVTLSLSDHPIILAMP